MSRTFYVALHALPSPHPEQTEFTYQGVSIHRLQASADGFRQPLPVAFDDVVAALETMPSWFVEPDGSFIWRSTNATATSAAYRNSWLEGNLFDCGGQVMYVDLKGDCTAGELEPFLALLGWPDSPLAWQMVHDGLFLDWTAFRKWLSSPAT